MTISSQIIDISSFTTDAKFRTWGSAVSAIMTAIGLTKTTDTGQVNWTTVARPTAANTKAGYEIWRFNDTLQATTPIYMRLEYGTGGNASGNNPNLQIGYGTGTDGAGTLTGVYIGSGAWTQSNSTAADNTNLVVRGCYSTTAGAFFLDSGAKFASANSNNSGTHIMSRTCDASGNPTGQAASGFAFGGSARGAANQFPVSFSPLAFFSSRNAAVGVLNVGSTSVSGGGVIELYRVYSTSPGPLNMQGAVGYLDGDIVQNSTFSAAPWVGSHTYLALGQSCSGPFEQSANTNISAAVIWE